MKHTTRIAVTNALHDLDAASIALATFLSERHACRPIGDLVQMVWVTATPDGWEIHINGDRPSTEATQFTTDQVLAW